MKYHTFLMAWFLCSTACAADLAVQPVRLRLSEKQNRSVLTVTNRSSESTSIQVDTFSWFDEKGENRQVPSNDLIINPPMFTLGPYGTQTIRVGMRNPAKNEKEIAYRILLRQIPSSSTIDQQIKNLQFLMQISLPVYIEPPQKNWSIKWNAKHIQANQITLTAQNTGSMHMIVHKINVNPAHTNSTDEALANIEDAMTLLPGQAYQWKIPIRHTTMPVFIHAVTDRGTEKILVEP
ncbi:fimbrial biogenesis chaperone [Laribacter hongkongensis]|uniref:fimbrial biogenesis chaperone n=1 Tax=Laribacter hongkongensis TaxID=168471 RepID=UPI001EFE7661|nr:fimbria/pilus periplasmic chaperone [Laribacter hongkongensis]MCG9098243.1 fimbria/pilus periplasmic chaperone [Laribacter hongkongensis]